MSLRIVKQLCNKSWDNRYTLGHRQTRTHTHSCVIVISSTTPEFKLKHERPPRMACQAEADPT